MLSRPLDIDEFASLATQPTAFRFKIKSFRLLTSDYKAMVRDVEEVRVVARNRTPVQRVDITKTNTYYEIHQEVYTPLIERALPDTFEEEVPAWMKRLPTRLVEAMIDHHVNLLNFSHHCPRRSTSPTPRSPTDA